MTNTSKLSSIEPQWDIPSSVTAFTTTRSGGVSKSPFEHLNLGLHVGDDKADVLENRRRLAQDFSLPAEPIWLNQTHGNVVVDVAAKSGIATEADGAYTCLPDTVLAVLTADCLPVVVSDVQGSQIAVVHAGWRGLANGILGNAVERFRKGSELHAWLGPAIGPLKFEVGDDVRDVFVQQHQDNAAYFADGVVAGKYWADLYALARSALVNAGCKAVSGGDYCTHSQADLFHSHRRDGRASGRIATLAWIS